MKNKWLSFLGIGALFLALSATVSLSSYSPPPTATPAVTGASTVPFSNAVETYGQCYNIASVYYNIPTRQSIANGTAVLDTGTAINLYVAGLYKGYVNTDTFNPTPINGDGDITFTPNILKVSGSPTVTATLKQSPDGVNWSDANIASLTLVPASLTVPIRCSTLTVKKTARYYYLAVSSTDPVSCRLYYYSHKNAVVNLSPN